MSWEQVNDATVVGSAFDVLSAWAAEAPIRPSASTEPATIIFRYILISSRGALKPSGA